MLARNDVRLRTICGLSAAIALLIGCGGGSEPQAEIDSTQTVSQPAVNDSVEKTPEPDPATLRAQESFRKLVAAHRNEDPDAWEKAWKETSELFIALGEPGVAILNDALKERDAVQREMAVTLLAASGADTEAAAAGLLAAMKDDAALVRVNAASALSHSIRHADQVVEVLDGLLADSSEVVRSTAVHSLANVGTAADQAGLQKHRIVSKISDRLKDSSAEVRRAAAEALGFLGPKAISASATLEATKNDAEAAVRDAANAALEKVKAKAEAVKNVGSVEKK